MKALKVKPAFSNRRLAGAAHLLCWALLFRPSPAWAQVAAPLAEPTKPQATEPSAPAPAAPSTQLAPSANDFKFDLYGDAPKESAAQAQSKLQAALQTERKGHLRRRMLTAHQVFGISTLVVLATTLVIGQLNYQDKYVTGDFTGRYEQAHLGLGIASTGLFVTTGALALFAPSPYEKKYRLDSAMVHRVAMALATAGMVTQIILGPIIDTHAGRLDQSQLALGHLVIGYATFAFMGAGTLAYVF